MFYSYRFYLPSDVNLVGRGGVSALHLAARSVEIEEDTKSVHETKRVREASTDFDNEIIHFFVGTLDFALFTKRERC